MCIFVGKERIQLLGVSLRSLGPDLAHSYGDGVGGSGVFCGWARKERAETGAVGAKGSRGNPGGLPRNLAPGSVGFCGRLWGEGRSGQGWVPPRGGSKNLVTG